MGLAISSVEARWAHRAVRPIRIGVEKAVVEIELVLDGANARGSTRDLVGAQVPANARARKENEGRESAVSERRA